MLHLVFKREISKNTSLNPSLLGGKRIRNSFPSKKEGIKGCVKKYSYDSEF